MCADCATRSEKYLCSLGRWVQFLLRDLRVREFGLGP